MKKTALIICICVFAAYAQQKSLVITDFVDEGTPPIGAAELSYLTDRTRSVAAEALPDYSVLSGSSDGSDYVTQVRIGRFATDLTIRVEIYESATKTQAGFFTDNAKDVHGLLSIVNGQLPAVFKNLQAKPKPATAAAPVAVPLEAAPVAAEPAPKAAAAYTGSNPCHKEIIDLTKNKKNISVPSLIKDLGISVVKVQASCKTKWTCPADNKVMDVGLTAGCIKQLPTTPAEITSLLKSIGLDFVASSAQELLDQSPEIIDSEIEEVESSGSGASFWVALGFDLIGVGLITWGIVKNSEVRDLHSEYRSVQNAAHEYYNWKWQDVENARKQRNILYTVGAAFLVTGIGVHIWF